MAASVICDKCGKVSSKITDFIHVRTHTLASATRYNTSALETFDVCTNCYDEIFNFKEDKNKV